jgi:vitamin B12 transporter
MGRPATANIGLRYNGDQTDTVFNSFFPVEIETKRLEGYTLVNAGLTWQVADRLEIFARGENLLDEHYQEVYGYGAPGLGVFAGLKLSLGGPPPKGGR